MKDLKMNRVLARRVGITLAIGLVAFASRLILQAWTLPAVGEWAPIGASVCGLVRFPVTLYKEQWTRLLDMADDIRTFITENEERKAKANSQAVTCS
jgi:hypothetical protein